MNENEWRIIDNEGTIHSGTEDEMRTALAVMTSESVEGYCDEHEPMLSPDEAVHLFDQYRTSWDGDLCLIEVHSTIR